MAELKTKVTDADPRVFINSLDDEQKKKDGLKLLEIFSRITGEKPKMWGSSIVGFGKYHYRSERSKQEGDWPLVSFSPRKQSLSLYLMISFDKYADTLARLGKHKTGVGCLYINKLDDVDMRVLEELIKRCYAEMKQKHSS